MSALEEWNEIFTWGCPGDGVSHVYYYPPFPLRIQSIKVLAGYTLWLVDLVINHVSQLEGSPVLCEYFKDGYPIRLPTIHPEKPLILLLNNPSEDGVFFIAKFTGVTPKRD